MPVHDPLNELYFDIALAILSSLALMDRTAAPAIVPTYFGRPFPQLSKFGCIYTEQIRRLLLAPNVIPKGVKLIARFLSSATL